MSILHHRYLILVTIMFLVFGATISAQDCCVGIRGNIDNDPADVINISDLVYLVEYMFSGGPVPPCPEEADVNGSQSGPDIADLVYLVEYMFSGGPPPADCSFIPVDTVIVPLTIGNEWLYHVVEYNSSGGIIAEYDTASTVVRDTIIIDSLWFIIDDGTGSMNGIFTNMDDGTWSHYPDSTPSEILALKYPATVGESYPYYDVTVHVDAINASVTVPAGTFSCYYYRMTVPIFGTVGKIWAAPNVGIVKAEQYDLGLFSTYLSGRVELLSFDIVE